MVSGSDLSPSVFKGPNLEKLRQVTLKPRKGLKKLHAILTLPAFFYCVYLGVLFPSKMADSGKMLEAAPHSRVVPVQTPAQSKPKQLHYPFWFGGSASCFAASVTHPLDLGMFLIIPSIYVLYADSPTVKVIGCSKPSETMAHARDSEPRC